MNKFKPLPISATPKLEPESSMLLLVSKQTDNGYISGHITLNDIKLFVSDEEVIPDKYEDLPKNIRNVFHEIHVSTMGDNAGHAISPYNLDSFDFTARDNDGLLNGNYRSLWDEGRYSRGTYKVVDCDEISVFGQSVRCHVGSNPLVPNYLQGLDVRKSDITRLYGESPMKVNLFDSFAGGYYPWGNVEVRALLQRKWSLFTNSSKNEDITDGWDVISRDEWLQLICQAPRYHGDVFKDIKDFFFYSPTYKPLGVDNELFKSKDISGLSFYPAGLCENIADANIRPLQVHYFGQCAVYASKRVKFEDQAYLTGFFQDTPTYGSGVWVNYWLAWGGNLRYSRIKTPAELGYKLVADKLIDKVVFVSSDWVNNDMNRYEELAVGAVRGTALRYANRSKRLFAKSYSEIVKETNEILSAIKIDGNA